MWHLQPVCRVPSWNHSAMRMVFSYEERRWSENNGTQLRREKMVEFQSSGYFSTNDNTECRKASGFWQDLTASLPGNWLTDFGVSFLQSDVLGHQKLGMGSTHSSATWGSIVKVTRSPNSCLLRLTIVSNSRP